MQVEELVEIEAIKQLKARYFYALDHKNWAVLRNDIFAADAQMLVAEAQQEPVIGGEAIVQFLAAVVNNVTTVHHGHMPVIEITSPTAAKGIWAMEDILIAQSKAGVPTALGEDGTYQGYGHYHEEYSKTDDGWRIQCLELTRLHFARIR